MPQQPQPEILLGLIVISLVILYAVIRWLMQGPVKPDPWGTEIEEEIQHGQALPLCPRCLTPHTEDVYFCETCGRDVGQYVNWSPYLYIFSLGDILLTGVSGKFAVSPLTVGGYLLLSLGQYSLFAPLYWFRFFKHLGIAETESQDGVPSPPPPVPPPDSPTSPPPPILPPPA